MAVAMVENDLLFELRFGGQVGVRVEAQSGLGH